MRWLAAFIQRSADLAAVLQYFVGISSISDHSSAEFGRTLLCRSVHFVGYGRSDSYDVVKGLRDVRVLL